MEVAGSGEGGLGRKGNGRAVGEEGRESARMVLAMDLSL